MHSPLFVYILGLVAAGALIVFLILRAKAKRQLQKLNTSVLNLKEGKANYEFDLNCFFNDAILFRFQDLLIEFNFRLVDNAKDGIIAYSGKSEHAALNGWLNVDYLSLPLRVVVMPTLTNKVKVKFADDYGFQILNTKQKLKFNEVYNPLFLHYESLIKKQIK
jgi:hypothetical protein